MVQALRPHDRLVGARVAVRLVLPRPDALGVLARSAQAARAAAVAVAPPGPIQSLVRSPGRRLQGRNRMGARPSRVDGDAGDCDALSARSRFRSMGVVGAGFVPEMDVSAFQIDIETPPGSNLEYTRLKAQEIARHRPPAKGSRLYLHHGRRTGRRRGRGHRLRQDGAQDGAVAQPGDGRR